MEKILAYRTKDGKVFFDEIEANDHEKQLDNKKVLAAFEWKNAIVPPDFAQDNNEIFPTRIMQHDYKWYRINDSNEWKQFEKFFKKEYFRLRINVCKFKIPSVFPTVIGVDSWGNHNILSEDDIFDNYNLARQRQIKKLDMIDKEFKEYQHKYYEAMGRKFDI
ncbi:hypothetical protein [Pseudobutyrivibrio sp. LB2011]|uniref:hypothetical protein n=1 Tax=Pseudobutyrivibrio sp. LB2011 TaxID=1408312 RepID=UPI0005D24833|nr:hypothetical protein [Pseudobutyrivibrio sp. LB2011]